MSTPRMTTPTEAPLEDTAGRNAARPDQDELTEQLHARDEGAPTSTGGIAFSNESAADADDGSTH